MAQEIEKDFKNFNFFVGLSEPLPEDNWEIKKKLEDKEKSKCDIFKKKDSKKFTTMKIDRKSVV